MERPASTCIIGRIGVNAKRPTPIGTARATMPASAMTSGDDARAGGTSQPVGVSRGATALEERTGSPGALRAMGGWGRCRGPQFDRRAMSGPPITEARRLSVYRGVPRLRRGAPSAGGYGGPCRGPPSLRHDAQDLVVALARAAAAVAVAGRDVERAVGADDDVAQPAVRSEERRV